MGAVARSLGRDHGCAPWCQGMRVGFCCGFVVGTHTRALMVLEAHTDMESRSELSGSRLGMLTYLRAREEMRTAGLLFLPLLCFRLVLSLHAPGSVRSLPSDSSVFSR